MKFHKKDLGQIAPICRLLLFVSIMSLEVDAALSSDLDETKPPIKKVVVIKANPMLFWIIMGMMFFAYTVGIGAAIYIGFIRKDPMYKQENEIS